jgi:hypothetical protein
MSCQSNVCEQLKKRQQQQHNHHHIDLHQSPLTTQPNNQTNTTTQQFETNKHVQLFEQSYLPQTPRQLDCFETLAVTDQASMSQNEHCVQNFFEILTFKPTLS